MKVSVIIPVYNVGNYLKRCMDSIVNQTYKNLEIILVDDGSTDSSSKICDDYATNDNRVRVFHLKNGGAAKARNFGIKKSTGDYLFFVDGDDFITLDTLESLLDVAEGKDIVYCDYYKYFGENNKQIINLISFDFDTQAHILAMPGPVCKLIKRELFVDNKLFFLEGRRYEDVAIMPYLSALAKDVAYLKEAKYYYFQRLGSSMNQIKYSTSLNDIFFAFDNLILLFKTGNMDIKFKDEIEYLYIDHLLHAASLRFLPYSEGVNSLNKIVNIIENDFPNWYKNKYYRTQSIKYKIVCRLIMMRRYRLLKRILKIK